MTEDPTSLDRLHDIAVPPAVPWWPLAPGWYLLLAALLAALAYLARRAWKHWQSQAYRRDAMAELEIADDPTAIAELLRRTALAIAPRTSIAGLQGENWPDWLAAQSPQKLTDPVREQLRVGIYARPDASATDLGALREFAAGWIKTHHPPQT